MVNDSAVQIGVDCLVQLLNVGQDRPDADIQRALASTPTHAPRHQRLAVLDGLHHVQMRDSAVGCQRLGPGRVFTGRQH